MAHQKNLQPSDDLMSLIIGNDRFIGYFLYANERIIRVSLDNQKATNVYLGACLFVHFAE